MRSGPRCDLQEVAVGNQIWLARYSPGVMPMTSRKAREKFDCEENPGTSSVANDPFQTSAARDCCDAQCGISYSGVVGCNSRGERSTCGRRRASTLGFTRPSQPSWENVGCADDPTSLRAMRCSASRPMGQSRRTNTPDEFAGWARFTSAATPLPRRRQARRTRAVLSIAMSASDASAAG